jgi:hypothetical protein
MSLTVAVNDTDNVLLYKIAFNLYSYALSNGYAGIVEPSKSDFDNNLLANAVLNSAIIADNA